MTSERLSQNIKMRVVSLAFEFGYIIAIPIVIFLFLGKYLDSRFNTAPFLTLTGALLAISITTVWLSRRVREIMRKMASKNSNNKKEGDKN